MNGGPPPLNMSSMGLPPSSKKPNTSDVRKIDPAEVLRPATPFDPSKLTTRPPVDTKPTPEQIQQDINARLNVQRAPAPAQAAAVAKAKQPPSFLETSITDEMVLALTAELGLAPQLPFYEGEVDVKGTPLKFKYRLPDADDNLWAMGVVVAMAQSDDRSLLLRTDAQLQTYSSHLVACMCVIELQGTPVWDHLKQTDRIYSMVPGWNGTWRHVPLVVRSIMAQTLYNVFSRTHVDLLTAIDDIITLKMKEPAPKGEEARPTTAT